MTDRQFIGIVRDMRQQIGRVTVFVDPASSPTSRIRIRLMRFVGFTPELVVVNGKAVLVDRSPKNAGILLSKLLIETIP